MSEKKLKAALTEHQVEVLRDRALYEWFSTGSRATAMHAIDRMDKHAQEVAENTEKGYLPDRSNIMQLAHSHQRLSVLLRGIIESLEDARRAR